MLIFNKTYFHPSTFILVGIPGLEAAHIWISIPFCIGYITALLGNSAIMYIIKTDQALHEPMYIFISMLAFSDICTTSTIMPKSLCIFWFSSHEINYAACLIQVFFVHCLSAVESGILAAMSYDRYVAICYPLRYTSILTNQLIATLGIAILIRAATVEIIVIFLVQRFQCFKSIVISHSYCDLMAVVKLIYGDITPINVFGLFSAAFIIFFDVIAISWSYSKILRAVFRIGSKDGHLKALSTCGAHFVVIVVTYVLALFSYVSHRLGQENIPAHVHIFLANIYILIPTMLNPFVYGANTKRIRERVLRMFQCRKDHVPTLR
ncbi:olfactory receptor 52J3-like [Rhinatrema bivittatum]|uniref:olfactory receptor 52J3-like n=1 Tax=Rhinatrema bivittatum TaxID=194408 RepID=UPI00112AFA37|nr:olfactory receptor 52J3-like [Rhinatrema bivittatum]